MNGNLSAEKFQHIVIEGPIGVGKSSLTQKLAEHLNADSLLEKPDDNPFLIRFYQDPQRYALSTQLFFLFQRLDQLRDGMQANLFKSRLIADFLLDKDPLFASLTLDEAELKLYRQIYEHQRLKIPKPDLVIYLQATAQSLLERVQKRAKSYESQISLEYLQQLNNAYSHFFYHYEETPLLIINTDHLNPIDRTEDFELLLHQIDTMKGRKEFFNCRN